MAELIVVTCPHCQKQLKAPNDRLGRAAKCPQCQQSFVLGEGAKASGSASGIAVAAPVSGISKTTPSATTAAPANKPTAPAAPSKWTLKIPSGDTYGPIERVELDQWFQEGRINAECQLLAEGAPSWQWASEIYPSLSGEAAVTTAPAVAPQIGAAVGAGVAKGWNALGGFMENVVGQIENNYSSPQTTNFQAAPQFSGPMEIQWQSVVAGLRVTKWSLLFGGAMVAIFGIFGFLISFRDRSSIPSGFVGLIMSFVTTCMMISLAAFFGNLIGWLVQTEIPLRARTRKLLHLALGCFGIVFAFIMVFYVFGTVESAMMGGSFSGFLLTTARYILPLIVLAGLGIYGSFLHTTNLFFGRRELRNLVMICFGLLGGTYLLYFLGTFITNPTLDSILSLLLSLLMAASLGQLGLMSHHVKQVIQAQQAQA
jgi:uncharacterized protein (DUF697 family)/endogenous inhibitor of DNA gyrase (YacG/DUF329 family)